MELNGKMNNTVKIALAVISVVLLLVIGGALGASFSYHRGYGYGDANRGCGFNNFERGDRSGNKQYRMMQFQEVPVNQVNQTPNVNQGTPINTPSVPATNPAPTIQ